MDDVHRSGLIQLRGQFGDPALTINARPRSTHLPAFAAAEVTVPLRKESW
jgi:hypothetical protein